MRLKLQGPVIGIPGGPQGMYRTGLFRFNILRWDGRKLCNIRVRVGLPIRWSGFSDGGSK
jgi:hypothetical protein